MHIKRGISLIVLIITIIIVIILAAAVILTISNNNPLSSAKEATFKSDIRTFQEELAMYISSQTLSDYYGNREKVTMVEAPSLEKMKEYIESYNKKYAFKDNDVYKCKLGIEDDELVYYADKVTQIETKWLDELGIKPSSYTVPEASEECFIWYGDDIIGYDTDKLKSYLERTNGQLKVPKRCKMLGQYLKLFSFKDDVSDYIKSIVFQDGITSMYYASFSGCKNLKKIYISKTLTNIDISVNFNNINLTNIDIDEENKTYSSRDSVVYNKKMTELIRAPGGIERCVIPDTVAKINDRAFSDCKSLCSVELPEGLNTIEYMAFYGCSKLSTIVLPSTLEVLEHSAFGGCGLVGTVVIPDKIKVLENGIFDNCSITKAVIGSGVQTIDISAYKGPFCKCNMLKEIEVKNDNNYFSSEDGILYNKEKTNLCFFPQGKITDNLEFLYSVTSIGEGALFNCNGITGSVKIPLKVAEIERYAFFGCTGITNINCEASSKPSGWLEEWNSQCNAQVNWSIK